MNTNERSVSQSISGDWGYFHCRLDYRNTTIFGQNKQVIWLNTLLLNSRWRDIDMLSERQRHREGLAQRDTVRRKRNTHTHTHAHEQVSMHSQTTLYTNTPSL
jgi:hypothetical protein